VYLAFIVANKSADVMRANEIVSWQLPQSKGFGSQAPCQVVEVQGLGGNHGDATPIATSGLALGQRSRGQSIMSISLVVKALTGLTIQFNDLSLSITVGDGIH